MKSIPLVQESKAFVENLKFWCKSFDENRYLFGKRVNYSYRFSSDFIEEQNRLFQTDPSTYLSVYGVEGGRNFQSVFDKKLTRSEIARIILKVVAHTLFRFIGSVQLLVAKRGSANVYRKAYVDDIDLVYDRLNIKMVMAVYPFAVNLPRQIRFIRGLIHDNRAFKLDGYDYRLKFLLNFLLCRDVRSYELLETSAAYLKSLELSKKGFHQVELSDEFDINCSSLTRFCRRVGLSVVNKTHGIGKYFPVQYFNEFYFLDDKMAEYYELGKESKCYKFDLLGDQRIPDVKQIASVCILFMSQKFDSSVTVTSEAEEDVLAVLADVKKSVGLNIYYKPHPNRKSLAGLDTHGVNVISSTNEVDMNEEFPIIISLFSSTHIDPNFCGVKLLIETDVIKPKIAFSTGLIVCLNELFTTLQNLDDELCALKGPYEFSKHGDLIRC